MGSREAKKFLVIYQACDEELAESFIAGFTIGEFPLMAARIGVAGLVDGVKPVRVR